MAPMAAVSIPFVRQPVTAAAAGRPPDVAVLSVGGAAVGGARQASPLRAAN